jgi:hypothetical protein
MRQIRKVLDIPKADSQPTELPEVTARRGPASLSCRAIPGGIRRLLPTPVFLLNVREENGRRKNWSGMRPPTASPARTALPAAHFERN